jgi:hypothetical protein
MKTASEISAEIAEMQRQIDDLQKAKKQRECDLLEAQLFEETGLRIGDKCSFSPCKDCPNYLGVYEVKLFARTEKPFFYLKGDGSSFIEIKESFRFTKIDTAQ